MIALQAIMLDNPTRLATKAIQDEDQSQERLRRVFATRGTSPTTATFGPFDLGMFSASHIRPQEVPAAKLRPPRPSMGTPPGAWCAQSQRGTRDHLQRPTPPHVPSLASRSSVHLEHSLLAYLADVAEERRVLTPPIAAKWRGAMIIALYEKTLAKARNLADYAEDRGQGSLFAIPPLQSFDEFLQDSMIGGAVEQQLQEPREEPQEQPGASVKQTYKRQMGTEI